MYLAPGFMIADRYRVGALIAEGSRLRVYEATTTPDGPGGVAVKVARHDDARVVGDLEAGRTALLAEWEALVRLHEHATSAAPLPIELVTMYPGDPAVRAIALSDKQRVRNEPYLICECAEGDTLATVIRGAQLDEERALLIALRVVLLIRSAREVGVELTDCAPTNFVVDAAGENVGVVGLSDCRTLADPPTATDRFDASLVQVPASYGRLLAGLLLGMIAPAWSATDDDRERWERLLASRRVPPEFHGLVLGCLGFDDRFEATLDAVENRLRGLVQAPRPRVWRHEARSRDLPYLIAPGERIADRFKVIAPLAQGGRGYIYRVRDERSDVEVLIKTNKYVYDSGSGFALELASRRLEIEHEWSILQQFSATTGMMPQPVALVRGLGRGAWFELAPDLARGEPYLAMEYIKGIPLLDLLPEPYLGAEGASRGGNRLRPTFVLRLVAQIADLMARFHDAGFLVQDLKPENVLYDARAENVYLIDFAGVCPRGPDGALARDHVAFGVQTHGFAAPEFADLWERVDDRFDIYSLGATAYHLLTGVNPERVAVDKGVEYPRLPRRVLQTLPPPVAELLTLCLAPVEQRIRSAREVGRLAEAARLQLSRSRPLDVRGLRPYYTDDGAELHFEPPEDPRVELVRAYRVEDEGHQEAWVLGGPEVVAEGRIPVPRPSDGVVNWIVQTGVERGQRKHSRGTLVCVEAHPPPGRLEAESAFGGVRVRLDLAPHASGASVRWSIQTTPMTEDDGEVVEPIDGVAFIAATEGQTVHCTAFARYEEARSQPRFAVAVAAGPAELPGTIRWRQTAAGIELNWERRAPELVFVVDRSGQREELVPSDDSLEFVDDAALPGERVEYTPIVRRGEVEERAGDTLAVHRWPSVPHFTVLPCAAAVEVDAERLDGRVSSIELLTLARGELVGSAVFQPTELPVRLSVPSDQEITVVARSLIDEDGDGPAAAVELVVPPSGVTATIDDRGGRLPIQMTVSLPEPSRRWSGVYTLRAVRDLGDETPQVIAEREGPTVELMVVTADSADVVIEDPGILPGEDGRYEITLTSTSGAVILRQSHELRGIEQLDAPSCVPALEAVVVERGLGVERADLRVEMGGRVDERVGVELPVRLDAPPGAVVVVSWRRTVSGVPMPWSRSTTVVSLARPHPVVGLTRRSDERGELVIAWDEPAEAGIVYEARDARGVLLYRGEHTEFEVNELGAPTAVQVVAVRDGLESIPSELALAHGGQPRSLLPLRRPAPARVRTRRPGRSDSTETEHSVTGVALAARTGVRAPNVPTADRLVQCVRVGRTGVAELRGGSGDRVVVALLGRDERELDASQGQLVGGAGLQTPGLVACVVASRSRVLVPWIHGRGSVRLLSSAMPLDEARWSTVSASVEPTTAHVVGSAITREHRLRLWAPVPLDLQASDAAVLNHPGGVVTRLPLSGRLGSRVVLGPAGIELDLNAIGLGISSVSLETGAATVLMPAAMDASRAELERALWQDAVFGIGALVAQGLERRWRAPVAARSLARLSSYHFVRNAEHVELRIEPWIDAPGRGRIAVALSSTSVNLSREFSVRLDRPRRLQKLVDRVVAWADRATPRSLGVEVDLEVLL